MESLTVRGASIPKKGQKAVPVMVPGKARRLACQTSTTESAGKTTPVVNDGGVPARALRLGVRRATCRDLNPRSTDEQPEKLGYLSPRVVTTYTHLVASACELSSFSVSTTGTPFRRPLFGILYSRQAAGADLDLNPDAMSASASRLTELLTEILEQMLLHLPGQDIIKMEAVRSATVIERHTSLLTPPRTI